MPFPAYISAQGNTVLILILLLFLFLSFVVSGAEVAFFSLSTKDMNLLKTKQVPAYKRILDLLQKPKDFLAALLIANIISNIAIIFILNILLNNISVLHQVNALLAFFIKVLIISFIILLFCEVMPKIFARQNNLRYTKDFVFLLVTEVVYAIFRKPGAWMVSYSDSIEKKFTARQAASTRIDEMYDVIETTNTGDDENSSKEKDILKGIVKFSNITVKQIMRTRLDVNGISYNTAFHELVKKIEELHYSRLPVYKDDLDEIAGIIQSKDILPYMDSSDDFDWHFLMRQPFFVHEQKLITDLLNEFRQKHIHFAVVVDEFGGTSGIVTLEDIVEEVVGEIKDEFDEEESISGKIDDSNYIVEGRMMINDVCRLMKLPADTFDAIRGSSDSIAGLVLEIAGDIPQKGQVIHSGDFEFTVMETEKNRLQKIKITIKPLEKTT